MPTPAFPWLASAKKFPFQQPAGANNLNNIYMNPNTAGAGGKPTQQAGNVWAQVQGMVAGPQRQEDPWAVINASQGRIQSGLEDSLRQVAEKLGVQGLIGGDMSGVSTPYATKLMQEARKANLEYGEIANRTLLDAARASNEQQLQRAGLIGNVGMDVARFGASREDTAEEQAYRERTFQEDVRRFGMDYALKKQAADFQEEQWGDEFGLRREEMDFSKERWGGEQDLRERQFASEEDRYAWEQAFKQAEQDFQKQQWESDQEYQQRMADQAYKQWQFGQKWGPLYEHYLTAARGRTGGLR